MKKSRIVVWFACGALLVGCQDDGGIELPDPEPEPEVASWLGAGDGASWSDDANWDRAPRNVDEIRISDANVELDIDFTIEVGATLLLTNASLAIDVSSLLINRGHIELDNGFITARQGGWFQNEGSLGGSGLITVECDDGGSSAGSVEDGVAVEMGECVDPCIDFDFNFARGTTVSDQYVDDLTVSAINNNPSHPNMAIVFDSADPSGDDTDLVTPGYGIGNDTALGGLVIIPENGDDLNADGLVDDPDDESAGGQIVFDFSCVYRVDGLQMIDVEEFGGSQIELFNGGNSVYLFNGAQLDDNSVQSLDFTNAPPADRMVVTMTGSGAVDNLRLCPTH